MKCCEQSNAAPSNSNFPEGTSTPPRFCVYPPIEKHGVIGDRRTAALVAADGTLDWFCAPDYDGDVAFGALLDPENGGFCRFGPETPAPGEQSYEDATVCLATKWRDGNNKIELADLMPWPGRERPAHKEGARVILRRLHCSHGEPPVRFEMRPRWSFKDKPRVAREANGVRFEFPGHAITLWTSFEVEVDGDGVSASFPLRAGTETWVMIGLDEDTGSWNAARCLELHQQTNAYWRDWTGGLKTFPFANAALQRSAIMVHLMAHAPKDAVVAAATTSLPERIGGDRNYDYRFAWVRDASLSAAFLATMGDPGEVAEYFTWLCGLDSGTDAPLQACYKTDGGTNLEIHEAGKVRGYRDSRPVRFGNHACKQRQIGSLGWFADSALIFIEAGGEWKAGFARMLHRAADYVCRVWREPDSGIWELDIEAHYVASKVMAWVTLDRAMRIARRFSGEAPDYWLETSRAIRHEVLERGWSEKMGAFRMCYDVDALDAASLLIPLMDFLPPDDPRVIGTLDAIQRELVIDGLVHRFEPTAALGGKQLPVGEFEGAFLPATFWFAHALAGAGRFDQARAILRGCEKIAGSPGIFAEEADARRKCFLGNTPLLFSQVEYARALLALHNQKPHRASRNP